MDPHIHGALLGTAIGDALGLPWEGMSAGAIAARAPTHLDHSALLGRGTVSDDTEQTVLLAHALASSDGDIEAFRRALARSLLRWFLALPVGIGFGTARAMLKLAIGVAPGRSGANSAGNGAAMRAAVLGLVIPEDELRSWVDAASLVTHRDPRAIQGALLVATAARIGSEAGHMGKRAAAADLLALDLSEDLAQNVRRAVQLAQDMEPARFTELLGRQGFISGFVNHTVPAALYFWLRFDDFELAVDAAVRAGGDTDTVAAIVGALMGATGGVDGIPPESLELVSDHRPLLDGLAACLSDGLTPTAPPPPAWHRQLIHNLGLLPRALAWVLIRRVNAG